MSDLIKRVDAINELAEALNRPLCSARELKDAIVSIPAVDAVEVVRCRECIYRVKLTAECTNNGGVWGNDGYCSDGKRREEVDNGKHL